MARMAAVLELFFANFMFNESIYVVFLSKKKKELDELNGRI